MAKKPVRGTPPISRIGQVRGHVGEAKARLEADRKQREAAGKAPNSIILDPGDVRGNYDAARLLETTLGGVRRKLTADDLAAFRRNMRTVQGRISSRGITAQQVIDLAAENPHRYAEPVGNSGDLGKARSEIKWATPVSSVPSAKDRDALDVRFLTDSGENSKVTRHTVIVRFNEFGATLRKLQSVPVDPARARAEKALTPMAAAAALQKSYLAIECSCERWRYHYRFIATIGGFNAGRDEHGMPKLTNPNLESVACKHVLKTMREVTSSRTVQRFLQDVLQKAMRGQRTQHVATQVEAEASANRQARRTRDISTTEERQSASRADRERQSLLSAARAPSTPPKRFVFSPAKKRAIAAIAKQLGLAPDEAIRRLTSPN